jgi:hypothetical protein
MSYNSNALISWKSNKAVLCLLFVVQLQASVFAQVNTKLAKSNETGTMVSFKGGSGDFPLVSGGSAAVFYIEQDLTH